MLDFMLSKINLLILVTAVFAIVIYFTFSLGDIMLVQRAAYIAQTYSQESASIINSQTSCAETVFTLPATIKYFGSKDFFYVMRISFVASSPNNHIVFSIASRKEPEKVIASNRVDTKAEAFLFERTDPFVASTFAQVTSPETITIDPQNKAKLDSFAIIKATYLGQEMVYITSCSSGGPGPATCVDNKIGMICSGVAEGSCFDKTVC